MTNVDIIISRFNEDLIWTQEESFNKFQYIVYNKGTNDNFNKTNLLPVTLPHNFSIGNNPHIKTLFYIKQDHGK